MDKHISTSSGETRWLFTKMHGAGNDFVVLNGLTQSLHLTPEVIRFLCHRQFGIGADQVLVVEAAGHPQADFRYRIFNSDGSEVEHCGNGARCFYRYVKDYHLSTKTSVMAEIKTGLLTLTEDPNGLVNVSMGYVSEDHNVIGFDPHGLVSCKQGAMDVWLLDNTPKTDLMVSVLSLANPHAMTVVDCVETYPIETIGPLVSEHRRFAQRINAGFMQIYTRHHIALRVYERGAGETLACGTGACAAVVMGIKRGLLDTPVKVNVKGGELVVSYDGHQVVLAGPTATVFEGEVAIPSELINVSLSGKTNE